MLSNSGRPINPNTMRKVKKEDDKEISNHFIDSYKKFKADIQDTDLLELLRHKTSTIDFNLKNFGIKTFFQDLIQCISTTIFLLDSQNEVQNLVCRRLLSQRTL